LEKVVKALKAMLKDSQSLVRWHAANALGRIGPKAAEVALQELIYAARDLNAWETRKAATFALGTVGYDAKNGPEAKVVHALLYNLKSQETCAQVRLEAVQSLSVLGPPKREEDAELKKSIPRHLEPLAARDPDKTVRVWAQMTIMQFTEVTGPRLVAIARMLAPTEPLPARAQAARALGLIGTKAKSQIPNLIEALKDRDAVVVDNAAW